MNIRLLIFTILSFFFFSQTNAQTLQTPAEFLGYKLGERFTPHHRMLEYFEQVADAKANIKIETYGETYEHRPLVVTYITSPENFGRLEEIRKNNLRRTGLEAGDVNENDIAIVWLSYNVHGNESVSSEAVMEVLYKLADPNNTQTQKWLQNTVVILDPCINPDGRERYVNWYVQKANSPANPEPDAWEHHEPWPGGRANHYLFDLNRDWAWLTQKESQQRVALYNQWLPHVHADFHEQGIDAPYYFAPAAEPLHELITDQQKEFEALIGASNVRYFDEKGWLYFTRYRFDLLYPSYGDTYPVYNGAIGMTYEQGGSGQAGLAVLNEEKDTLTLADRISHHVTTSLSTIEVASTNAEKLVDNFAGYYQKNRNDPPGKYKSFVIKADSASDKISALTKLLDQHKIEYGINKNSRSATGFSYQQNRSTNFQLENGDLVISAYQPKSVLVQVLFEPQTYLSDSITYDITAWSIPYAYDLDAYAVSERMQTQKPDEKAAFTAAKADKKAYAYVFRWESAEDARLLAQLLKAKIKVQFTEKSFSVGGNTFDAGSLIVTRAENQNLKIAFDEKVVQIANEVQRKAWPIATGFVTQGGDVGSDAIHFIPAPKILLLAGETTSSYSFGEIWHFFEQQVHYPVTIVEANRLDDVGLYEYDVLIFPDGDYEDIINKDERSRLEEWIREGGKLILLENALETFVDNDAFDLKRYEDEDEKERFEKMQEQRTKEEQTASYADRERRYIREEITGSIFKVNLDNTHPLAFGYPTYYYTLKRSGKRYAYLADEWNVGVIPNRSARFSGFAGSLALENIDKSLVFGVEEKGRGSVVYMVDNPLFRAFWHNGKLLFGNAVFLVGN